MDEMFLLRQLFGNGQGWLPAALLICLFLVVLLRPDRVRSPSLFRLSCVLLALSVMVPSLLTVCLGLMDQLDFNIRRSLANRSGIVPLLTNASGPVLLGLSIIFGLLSLSLGSAQEECPQRDRSIPPSHPLEK